MKSASTLRRVAGLAILFAFQASPRCALAENTTTKPAAPVASQHVESVNYDHWLVTCQDSVRDANKICVANLRVLGSDGKQPIVSWQIGYNKENRVVSVFMVSPSLTARTRDNKVSIGVSTKNGVELKLGASAPRRLIFEGCTPQVCEAVLPVDDNLLKDAASASTTAVTITTLDGAPLPMSFESKGLDKALAAVTARKI